MSRLEPVRAVVLDAMGVIYESGDDVTEVLLPFARARGCARSDEEVLDLYERCSLGEFGSARLWRELGIEGDPVELDELYLRGHAVRDGLVRFLDRVSGLGLALACLSNDVAEWSRRLRALNGLGTRIGHWTISGEVGARKPDGRIFMAFARATGLRFQ